MSLIAASISRSLAAGLKETDNVCGMVSIRLDASWPTPFPSTLSSARNVAISPCDSSFDSKSSSGLTLAKS
eukprot:scaffold22164_cov68-Phaeocystis_antarctica.AAC.2